ncbi:unnamed protein product [Urochloa humidicola]
MLSRARGAAAANATLPQWPPNSQLWCRGCLCDGEISILAAAPMTASLTSTPADYFIRSSFVGSWPLMT